MYRFNGKRVHGRNGRIAAIEYLFFDANILVVSFVLNSCSHAKFKCTITKCFPVIIIVRFEGILTEMICIPNPILKPRQKTEPHDWRWIHLSSYSSENNSNFVYLYGYGNVHGIAKFHIYLFAQWVIFLSRDKRLLIDSMHLRFHIYKFIFMKGWVTNF